MTFIVEIEETVYSTDEVARAISDAISDYTPVTLTVIDVVPQ